MNENSTPFLERYVHFWNAIMLATALEVPGMFLGLYVLYKPNPGLLTLFMFIGLPLIFLGLCVYLYMVYRIIRNYKLI